MKKAVVMLITLFFVTSISLIIIKNLDDSNKFIEEIGLDPFLTQLNLTDTNFKDEIIELVSKNKENIDEVLEVTSLGIPFSYGDLNLTVILEDANLPECSINDIKAAEQISDSNCSEDIIESILYEYDFKELLNKYQIFVNQEQIDFFFKEYKQLTKDDTVDQIKDLITYIKPFNESSNNKYLRFRYSGLFQDKNISGEFIFDLESQGIEDIVQTSLIAD
jgi:hypothetical protein